MRNRNINQTWRIKSVLYLLLFEKFLDLCFPEINKRESGYAQVPHENALLLT
jgi:hypothetical protein